MGVWAGVRVEVKVGVCVTVGVGEGPDTGISNATIVGQIGDEAIAGYFAGRTSGEALLVQSALRKKDNELQKARVMATEILVAAHDLPVGTKISLNEVALVPDS